MNNRKLVRASTGEDLYGRVSKDLLYLATTGTVVAHYKNGWWRPGADADCSFVMVTAC